MKYRFLHACVYFIAGLMIITSSNSFSEEIKGSTLFIVTAPFGAEVSVDDTSLEDTTPLVVKGLPPGRHTLEIIMGGYKSVAKTIDLQESTPHTEQIKLEKLFISMSFNDENKITAGADELSSDTLQVEAGTYSFSREDEGLTITPIYPYQRVIDTLNFAIPAAAIFSGILTVSEFVRPRNESASLSPLVVSMYVVTAGLTAVDIGMYRHKDRFSRSFTVAKEREILERALRHYRQAESLASEGAIKEAQFHYTEALSLAPGTEIYPTLLYKSGKIHQLNGNIQQADRQFSELLADYPVPELYDQALSGRSEVLFSQGLYAESIDLLNEIEYVSDAFTREEIELLKCRRYESWSSEDTAMLETSVQAWKNLVNTFPDSRDIGLYRYYYAAALHKNNQTAEARKVLASIERADPDSIMSVMIEKLEDQIR